MGKDALKKRIENVRKEMEKAAKDLDFISAAHYRDEMLALQKLLNEDS
jgi:excinuclease ABC subunit B